MQSRTRLIRTLDELILAKFILDQNKLTSKPLALSEILRQIKQSGKWEVTKAFRQVAYRFLDRLLKLSFIDIYYETENPEWRYFVFWFKTDCVQRLQKEIDDVRSNIC